MKEGASDDSMIQFETLDDDWPLVAMLRRLSQSGNKLSWLEIWGNNAY